MSFLLVFFFYLRIINPVVTKRKINVGIELYVPSIDNIKNTSYVKKKLNWEVLFKYPFCETNW